MCYRSRLLINKFNARGSGLWVRTQVYQIRWNNTKKEPLRRSRSFKVTDFSTNRRASPPFGWYSLRLPTKGWPGWVGLGGWLHIETNVPHRKLNPDTVTHPSTNRGQRRLTLLMETNALPLRQPCTKYYLFEAKKHHYIFVIALSELYPDSFGTRIHQ